MLKQRGLTRPAITPCPGGPRSGLRVAVCCTWWPRRPGTLPSLPLHFRTRLRGARGSARVLGVRVRCDSATAWCWPGFAISPIRRISEVPEGPRRGTLWTCIGPWFLLIFLAVSLEEEGRGRALEDSWAPSSPRPSLRAEIVLEASGARRPAPTPECWNAGRLRGGTPRVAPADACPAVTRVGPAGYGHHLNCVWLGPILQSLVLKRSRLSFCFIGSLS